MFKIILSILLAFFISSMCMAEDIHFDGEKYTLKYSDIIPSTTGYGNEYLKSNENFSNWTKKIAVYYYPNETSPIKFVENFDKTIENTENSILLKMIANKKDDKSIISFLVNGCENAKKYFEYDVYKFEKQATKGMVAVKYSEKYFFTNEAEINTIVEKVKEENDKYLEMLAVSQLPDIVEKVVHLAK